MPVTVLLAARHTTDFCEKPVVASHVHIGVVRREESERETERLRERERDTERGSARESEGD